MKVIASIFLVVLFAVSALPQNQKELNTAAERAEKSSRVLKQLSALGSDSLPLELMQKARAVAVFPSLKRVNILLNELTLGNGLVAVRNDAGEWGAPAFLALKAQDINLKMAGSKSFDVVLLFMDEQSAEGMKKGDISFASGGKRKIALGPVVSGSGADDVLKSASVLYYALKDGQLIDTGLGNDSFFKAVAVLHDNNMNKVVYGVKTKAMFGAAEKSGKISDKIETYRTVLKEITEKAAPQSVQPAAPGENSQK